MLNRRQFVVLLSVGAGATLLPACGSGDGDGGDGGSPPAPNGYRFSPIVSIGDTLPDGDTVASFIPHYMWVGGTTRSSLFFQAVGASGTEGIFEFIVDSASGDARVIEKRTVLTVGMTLEDPTHPSGTRTVDREPAWDVSARGTFLVVVESFDLPPALYQQRRGEDFRRLLGRKPLAEADTRGRMKGVSIGENDDLLVVGEVPVEDTETEGPLSLIHFPSGRVTGATRLVTAGDPVPGGTLLSLSLPMMGADGYFAFQGLVGKADGTESLCIFTSLVSDPGALICHDHDNARDADQPYHPRLSPEGILGEARMLDGGGMELLLDGDRVFGSGDRLPTGGTVTELNPPVFGRDGHVFFAGTANDVSELVTWDGATVRTLLAAGDPIADKVVAKLAFGTRSRQADSENRLVALVAYEAPASQSIVLGVPV
jgi:hypothetical protein